MSLYYGFVSTTAFLSPHLAYTFLKRCCFLSLLSQERCANFRDWHSVRWHEALIGVVNIQSTKIKPWQKSVPLEERRGMFFKRLFW